MTASSLGSIRQHGATEDGPSPIDLECLRGHHLERVSEQPCKFDSAGAILFDKANRWPATDVATVQ